MPNPPGRWLLLVPLLLAGCASPPSAGSDSPSPPPSPAASVTRSASPSTSHVTGTYPAHCTLLVTAGGIRPDPACTPGAVASTDRAVVCVAGYSAAHRPPSRETGKIKAAAMRAYAVSGPAELDHLVPLSLGGSNDVANLWPEPGGVPNSKDKVEASVLVAVCKHGADLATAQQAIAEDWTTAAESIR